MSDILIRGMEMPKSCADCFLEDPYDGYNCRIIPKSANWGLGERPSWCPLVEVPTPHGRLIDADKLCLSSGFSTATEYGMGRSDQIEAIKSNAPTIIPASGGAEDDR